MALDPILGSIHTVVISDASKFEDIRYPTISARDWVRMQYKGKTIDGYKSKLESYKATIGIAFNLLPLYVLRSLTSQSLLIWTGFRINTSLAAEAIEEINAMIHDAVNQTQPNPEVHLEGITESLHSLAVEASSLSSDRNALSIADGNLQALERREKALEEDRLALEAEKKAMKQSQQACTTAIQQTEGGPSQHRSVHVTFSGVNI